MLNFTGSALDIASGICLIVTIVFTILNIGQGISILLLRNKMKKDEEARKNNQTKLMSLAGFSLLAAGFSSVIWFILCPIMILVYCVLSCYNVPQMEELITTGQITPPGAKKAAKAAPKPAPQPEPVPEPVPEPAPEVHVMNEEEEQELVASLVREEISIEEAHEALTDEIAVHFVEVEDSHSGKRFQSKAIINIDTLSLHFENGDTVTLDALKEKKLIPPKTDYIKILAHGKLDKHLTVEVQDYSIDAVKMIILTGGKVIKKI